MRLSLQRDQRGYLHIVEVELIPLSPTQLAMLQRSGQLDSGQRQRVRPVLGDNGYPLTFAGGEAKDEAEQAIRDLIAREREQGRTAERVEIDPSVPTV